MSATGKIGEKPKVELPTPIDSSTSERTVITAGSGTTVHSGQLVEFGYTLYDGQSGQVAGSGYAADGRTAGRPLGDDHPALEYAQSILAYLAAPEAAFVLDVAEGPDGLRLLELNPFSGADLYACDRSAVVDAIHGVLG